MSHPIKAGAAAPAAPWDRRLWTRELHGNTDRGNSAGNRGHSAVMVLCYINFTVLPRYGHKVPGFTAGMGN